MNWLFWFGIAFTLVAPIVIGVAYGDPSTSWVAALCGAFVAFMAKIESVAELSLGPVKARMKETIQEANASIDQLRAVAAAHGEAAITLLIDDMFWSHSPFLHRLKVKDDVMQALEDAGVAKAKRKEIHKIWQTGICILYYNKIGDAIGVSHLPSAFPEYQVLFDPKTREVAAPDEFRRALQQRNALNDEASQWIDDYEHFLATGEIRRLDLWEVD